MEPKQVKRVTRQALSRQAAGQVMTRTAWNCVEAYRAGCLNEPLPIPTDGSQPFTGAWLDGLRRGGHRHVEMRSTVLPGFGDY